jgi:O-antigen ligase
MRETLFARLWAYAGCLLFFVTIFAGNFNLCRFYLLASPETICAQPIMLRYLSIFLLLLWVFYQQCFMHKTSFFYKLESPIERPSLIGAGLFVVTVGISLLTNASVIDAGNIFRLFSEFAFMCVLILLILINFADKAALERFFRASVIASMALAFIAYSRIGDTATSGYGITTFSSPLGFYRLQLVGFVFALHLSVTNETRQKQILYAIAAVIIGFSVLTTYSKAAFGFFNLTAFLVVASALVWKNKRAVAITVFIAVVVNSIFAAFLSHPLAQRLKALNHTGSVYRKGPGCDLTLFDKCYIDYTHRIPLFKETLTWHEGGLFFGKGYGEFNLPESKLNWRYDPEDFVAYTYPHNVLLDILYSFGLIPLIAFILMSLVFARYLFAQATHILFVLPIILLLALQFAGDIIELRLLFVIFVIVKLYQKLARAPEPHGQVL